MLLKFADPAQVRAYSPLLYKYHADWVPLDLPVHDGSLEHILQLEPELLISGEYNAILLRKRLQQLGKQVEVLALPTTLDSIRAYQAEFLRLIGAHEGSGAVGWDRAYPPRHQSLLLLGANGIGTGSNTLEDDLLRKAGWAELYRCGWLRELADGAHRRQSAGCDLLIGAAIEFAGEPVCSPPRDPVA